MLPPRRGVAIATARAQLAAGLRGRLSAPGDAGYDAARTVWNADIDRRPALVAHCAGVADVALCVRVAREHDLPLAVRGGGHNVAGFGTCDDGLVCDLGALRGVRVHPSRTTATVQGGATWSDFDAETQAFGLATTGGVVVSTGVGGLTLGGGIGWLKRHYGLTCDNLLGADVLVADGSLVRASADENPDLFRALRGGGGNFGIVTAFDFALHEVETVIGGYLAFEIEHLAELLRWYREAAPGFPRELTTLLFIMSADAKAPMPERLWGKPVMLLGACWSGDLRAGERVLAQLRLAAPVVVDALEPMRYLDLQQAFVDAPQALPGYGNYWKAEYLSGLPDAAVDAFTEHVGRVSSKVSYMEIDPLGGAIADVGEDETAIGFRGAPFLYQSNAVWEPGDSERDRHVGWARDFFAAMAPFSAGATYLNFIGEEGSERVQGAFRPPVWDALVATKRRFDPGNVFRVNQNIAP